MSYWTKLFMMLGKLQRAYHTLRGHFAPSYLGGSFKLRAYLFFIYGPELSKYQHSTTWCCVVTVAVNVIRRWIAVAIRRRRRRVLAAVIIGRVWGVLLGVKVLRGCRYNGVPVIAVNVALKIKCRDMTEWACKWRNLKLKETLLVIHDEKIV